MHHAKLSDMQRGWFIGDFVPSLCQTKAVEVAVKEYKAGDSEKAHYHKAATEYTVVIFGRVRMLWEAGDIIVVEPGDATDFTALTDAVNVVVKLPGAKKDKYLVDEGES